VGTLDLSVRVFAVDLSSSWDADDDDDDGDDGDDDGITTLRGIDPGWKIKKASAVKLTPQQEHRVEQMKLRQRSQRRASL
jgi:hypothetical protein